MPVPLDATAWKLGETPDKWPRSRYSGTALRPGEMAVTIVVSWSQLFGHSYLVLEWYADERPGPRTLQRSHEVYHLLPELTESERSRGMNEPGTLQLLSWRARKANVVVEHDLEFFPRKDASGSPLPAYFQSWLVPFADGWRAREAAIAEPPQYNYFGLRGGKNCARWVLDVAARAGIEARHPLSDLIAVPKRLIRPEERIEDEERMWARRRA